MKCIYLHTRPWLVRLTATDLNPDELSYYPFVVSLDRCSETFNTVDNLSDRLYAHRGQKRI